MQLIGTSEGVAFATDKKSLWRTINTTRFWIYITLAILGRVLPPLESTPTIIHESISIKDIRSVRYDKGIYKPTELPPDLSKDDYAARVKAASPGHSGKIEARLLQVEAGVAKVFAATQKTLAATQGGIKGGINSAKSLVRGLRTSTITPLRCDRMLSSKN